MRGGLVGNGTGISLNFMGGQTALYVVGRSDRGRDHMDSHSERFCPWTRTFCVIDCDCTACGFLSDPALFGMDQEPFSWKKAGGLLLAVAGIMIFQLSGTK